MVNNTFPENSNKVINAWCSYDIANSAYNLSISTVLYPIYYETITQKVFGSEMVQFMGMTIKNTVIYEYAISIAYLVAIILTVAFSGFADIGGYRKRFMQGYTFLGAISCMTLYFFNGNNLEIGIVLPAMAVVGFAGSLVYYNSFLPIIASPEKHDKISARGFSYGYAGSMLLLIFNIFTIQKFDFFGFNSELEAIRFSFVLVGVWWIGISQIAFYYLKENKGDVKLNKSVLSKGLKEILSVMKIIKKSKVQIRFLLSFFFFSMGVQTIIIIASLFGKVELNISATELILTILIIQLVAIFGAFLFGRVSTYYGNKTSLIWMLSVWILICISAYFITNETQFYVLGGLVGLVMGGIQSQARSTWSKLIPQGSMDTASFFSFYDSTEKLAITIGMLGFGVIEQITGSMRMSALLLSSFFMISLVIIAVTKLKNQSM